MIASDAHTISRLWGVVILLFVAFLLLILVRQILRFSLPDPDFAKSFLCTLTPRITSSFGPYAAAYRSGEIEDLVADFDVGQVFDRDSVFDNLVEAIILVDSNNKSVAMTTSADAMLTNSGVMALNAQDMTGRDGDAPARLVRTDLDVGRLLNDHSVDISVGDEFWRVYVYPVKEFKFRKGTVAYAIKVLDIAGLAEAVEYLNTMRKWVELLAAHLVPWPIPDLIFNQYPDNPDASYHKNDEPRVLCATFIVSCWDQLELSDICHIQKLIREALELNPKLSYSGRSIQFFRVFTGHFDTTISTGDPGKMAVFTHSLIESLRNYGDSVGKRIDIHCGIHSSTTSDLRFRSLMVLQGSTELPSKSTPSRRGKTDTFRMLLV
jgi:hypothetical protein